MKVYDYKLIKKFKVPTKEIKILTKDKMDFLVSSVIGDTITKLRFRSLILSLISTGCRINELLGLNRKDLNIKKGTAVVHGKGGRDRTVIFSGETLKSIEAYLSKRTDSCEALFATVNKGNEKRWKSNDVERTMRNFGKKIGLDMNLHPHLLRRSAASWLYHKNAPLPVVKKFLGHSLASNSAQKYYLGEIGFDEVQDFHRKIMVDFNNNETGTEKGGVHL